MAFRTLISTVAASFLLCGGACAAAAGQLLGPLDPVRLVTNAGYAESIPTSANPQLQNLGSIALPDLAAVLGAVLHNPIEPWSTAGPPPTMADVIGVVDLTSWRPYDPLNPDASWGGGVGGGLADASAAWRARMAAYQAQSAEKNAQKMNAFSEEIRAKFDVSMDPTRSPFDGLVASELGQDGGVIATEFHWGSGDMGHVESVFAKFPSSQSGFFGE